MILHIARFSRRTLTNARGVVDIASILVGVLITGIIAGGILATVFMVVPWAQDESAKSDLQAVRTAESVYSTQALADGSARYADFTELASEELIQDSDTVVATTNGDGTCYTAVSTSASGNHFWSDSFSASIQLYVEGVSTSSCVSLAGLIPAEGGEVQTIAVPITVNSYGASYEQPGPIDWGVEPFASAASCNVTGMPQPVSSISAVSDGVDITLDPFDWKVGYGYSALEDKGFIELITFDLESVSIGDGSQEQRYAFFHSSLISYEINGCPDVNYFQMESTDAQNPVDPPVERTYGSLTGAAPILPFLGGIYDHQVPQSTECSFFVGPGEEYNFCVDGNFTVDIDNEIDSLTPQGPSIDETDYWYAGPPFETFAKAKFLPQVPDNEFARLGTAIIYSPSGPGPDGLTYTRTEYVEYWSAPITSAKLTLTNNVVLTPLPGIKEFTMQREVVEYEACDVVCTTEINRFNPRLKMTGLNFDYGEVFSYTEINELFWGAELEVTLDNGFSYIYGLERLTYIG